LTDEERLLEMKKGVFENAVRRCAKELGLDYAPKVSVTETPCPMSSGNEIAHIHPEEGIICIWQSKLAVLDFDTIEQVAAHEVAHLVSVKHGGLHARTQSELQQKIWRPPGGVVVIDGSEKGVKHGRRSKVKKRVSKNVCAYHDCNVKTRLRKCKFCGRYFCNDHINPAPPSFPFSRDPVKMQMWREPGHPCPEHYDDLQRAKKEDLDKRWKALDELKKVRGPVVPEDFKLKPTPSENLERPRKTRRNIAVTIVAIVVIILILLFSFGLL